MPEEVTPALRTRDLTNQRVPLLSEEWGETTREPIGIKDERMKQPPMLSRPMGIACVLASFYSAFNNNRGKGTDFNSQESGTQVFLYVHYVY